jgi:hypothetical protein
MTNGWMNRASDHGKAVPAGASRFSLNRPAKAREQSVAY